MTTQTITLTVIADREEADQVAKSVAHDLNKDVVDVLDYSVSD